MSSLSYFANSDVPVPRKETIPVPTDNNFARRYDLHYQPKKVEVDEVMLHAQFGCLNFHM
jgi:hypothetical protein